MSWRSGGPGEYERADLGIRGVAIAAASVALGLTAVMIALALPWLIGGARRERPESVAESPVADWAAVADARARREGVALGRLSGCAWVDEQAGIARIPIEDAMAIIVERQAGGPATGDGSGARP